jgi:hypothetical protein
MKWQFKVQKTQPLARGRQKYSSYRMVLAVMLLVMNKMSQVVGAVECIDAPTK